MKVAVLMGGTSPERDVSVKSGKAVLNALLSIGVDAIGVPIEEETGSWFRENLPVADVYFLALHGGRGEDGTVQTILEEMGLRYTGSGPKASSLAMDKFRSRLVFSRLGLFDISWSLVDKDSVRMPEFALPWVVKPVNAGSSVGLSLVRNEEEFCPALDQAFRFSDSILVEEFIMGREITVGIVADKVLEPIEIVPKESEIFDYQSKYTKGKTDYVIPAQISEELRTQVKCAGRKAYDELGCQGYGRVDMIVDWQGRIVVLEVNTLPGMTETSLLPMACKYEGLGFEELCYLLCKMAEERVNYGSEKKG